MLFVRLVDLFESGLGSSFGFFHLVLDLIDVFLLFSDNVRQILVDFIDLVHPLIDFSDFFFPFPHDFFLETVLLELELLLLEDILCRIIGIVVGISRCVVKISCSPRTRTRTRTIPLLILFHLFLDFGFGVCDIGLYPFKVAFQFEECLFLCTCLRLIL